MPNKDKCTWSLSPRRKREVHLIPNKSAYLSSQGFGARVLSLLTFIIEPGALISTSFRYTSRPNFLRRVASLIEINCFVFRPFFARSVRLRNRNHANICRLGIPRSRNKSTPSGFGSGKLLFAPGVYPVGLGIDIFRAAGEKPGATLWRGSARAFTFHRENLRQPHTAPVPSFATKPTPCSALSRASKGGRANIRRNCPSFFSISFAKQH